MEGLYNLKLPLEYFNRKGFYTVYIKPREIPAVIADVSSLTSFPNVRGIVIDSNDTSIDEDFRNKIHDNNALVGYRIIFLNDNGNREDYYRLVTSNNRCEPVVQSSNESGNKSYTYRYNETSSLSFLTLTPSVAPSFKSTSAPKIPHSLAMAVAVTILSPVTIITFTDAS